VKHFNSTGIKIASLGLRFVLSMNNNISRWVSKKKQKKQMIGV